MGWSLLEPPTLGVAVVGGVRLKTLQPFAGQHDSAGSVREQHWLVVIQKTVHRTKRHLPLGLRTPGPRVNGSRVRRTYGPAQTPFQRVLAKLGDVASDVLGASGPQMLEALVRDVTDASLVAGEGQPTRQAPATGACTHGTVRRTPALLLAQQLAHLDGLDALIEQISREIGERFGPVQDKLDRLDAITGVGRRTAEIFLAEIGTDVTLPNGGHLASWAAMCPGNNESAGKRKSGKTGKDNQWVRTALVEAAHAVSHTKDTHLSSQFHHFAARRGKKRALVAVGHSILRIIWHLLERDCEYVDLGSRYLEERDRQQNQRRLVRRLEDFGYKVKLEPTSAA